MELTNLEVYIISMTLSDQIWNIVNKLSFFERDTIGKQITRSSDSVSANISEGFGRYYFKDHKVFLFYARDHYMKPKHGFKRPMIETSLAVKNSMNLMKSIPNLELNLIITSEASVKPLLMKLNDNQ